MKFFNVLMSIFVLLSSLITFQVQAQEAPPSPIEISLMRGWNLKGNSSDVPIDVQSTFGSLPDVATIWKWDFLNRVWQFYTAKLDAEGLAAYAASHGHEVLDTIYPGEGFWVSSGVQVTVPLVGGSSKKFGLECCFATLPDGWSLLAVLKRTTPYSVSTTFTNSKAPPSPDAKLTSTIKSVWSWDTTKGNWYFYSLDLEMSCGKLQEFGSMNERFAAKELCIKTVIAEKGYLDFGKRTTENWDADGKRFFLEYADKWIEPGEGFWVNNKQ